MYHILAFLWSNDIIIPLVEFVVTKIDDLVNWSRRVMHCFIFFKKVENCPLLYIIQTDEIKNNVNGNNKWH